MTIFGAVGKSIEYIEANLDNDIGVFDVANAACYSQFYFSRQFSLHTHTSVYDYILKRKLSESYKLLFSEKPKIVDLALAYGFSSHEVYTRAFRKMFGENPSEAAEFKPLLIYERIGKDYLDFLFGLRVEIIDETAPDCFFEPDFKCPGAGYDSLVVLSRNNMLCIKALLQGTVAADEDRYLSFKLSGLKHIIRIHNTDQNHSLRYFFNNFYDATALSGNFVLLKRHEGFIDVIIPKL